MVTIEFNKVDDEYGCFSNFAPYSIELMNRTWPTSEHYFQAQKYMEADVREEIRNEPSPQKASITGRESKKPPRSDWKYVKEGVMGEAVMAKFLQYPELKEILMASGSSELVYHTRSDGYWGDGMDGSGKNMLGQILMEVREIIRKI